MRARTGLPEAIFLICPFWLIDVLWVSRDSAREMFSYGLLARIFIRHGANFSQTMARLILTAMQLSRSWEDRFWRG
jgi:hypothetical protein